MRRRSTVCLSGEWATGIVPRGFADPGYRGTACCRGMPAPHIPWRRVGGAVVVAVSASSTGTTLRPRGVMRRRNGGRYAATTRDSPRGRCGCGLRPRAWWRSSGTALARRSFRCGDSLSCRRASWRDHVPDSCLCLLGPHGPSGTAVGYRRAGGSVSRRRISSELSPRVLHGVEPAIRETLGGAALRRVSTHQASRPHTICCSLPLGRSRIPRPSAPPPGISVRVHTASTPTRAVTLASPATSCSPSVADPQATRRFAPRP